MNFKAIFSVFTKPKAEGIKGSKKGVSRDDELTASNATGFVAHGVAKRKLGNYAAAIREFDRALQLDPTCAEALFERSKAKRKSRDVRGADRDLNDAKIMLDRLDDGLKAHETAGAAFDSGNYEEALRHYNEAISIHPSLTCIYYDRGTTKHCLEDYRGAIEDYTKSIEAKASNMSDAFYERGKIKYHQLNDGDGALKDFNAAIALCPTDADMLASRSVVLNDYDALQDLTRAIEMSPTNARLFYYRSTRRVHTEDLDGAIEDLTRFIEMGPTDAGISISQVYHLRGAIKSCQHDYTGAIHDYNKAIELDDSRSSTYFERGVTKHELNDYEGAILDFSRAIALCPSDALAYQLRGLARVEAGLHSEAEKDFNDARSLGYDETAG